MLIEELEKLKNGDKTAANRIIKHYEYFIYYLIKKFQITDEKECYDCVVERMLKSFYKFNAKNER